MIQVIKQPKTVLHRDEEGATIVEFALVAPVLIFMMMGVFDIGYGVYMRSVIDGAVQEAARDAALESGPSSLSAIDMKVEATIKKLNKNAIVETERKNYLNYSDVSRAESFTDSNGNGVCDNGESFGDENDNGDWDEDVGDDGVGGPRDIVYYTVTVGYNQLFPFRTFARTGTTKKIVGYKEEVRPVYRRVPAGYTTINQPVYSTEETPARYLKLPVYQMINSGKTEAIVLPEYKNVRYENQNSGPRRVPVYSTSGGVEKLVRMPVYETENVPLTDSKPRAVPVYKLVGGTPKEVSVPVYKNEVLGGDGHNVEVPIYKLTKATRDIVNKQATMVTYKIPVYRNVTYTENGKEKIRREFVRYANVKRPSIDSITQVVDGTKIFYRRELVGYKTIKRSDLKLNRTLVGYQTITKMVGQKRVLTGYKTLPRPYTVKRTLVGYKNVKQMVGLKRTLIGYETINRPKYGVKRVLTGYKTVVRPVATKRVLIGYKTVKQPRQVRKLIGHVEVKKPYGFKKELVREDKVQVPVYQKQDTTFTIKGLTRDRIMSSSTVLRNQPYGDQTTIATVTRQCTS